MWRDFIELCKPKVVLLMLLTAAVGMALSTYHAIPFLTWSIALLGIGLTASSAATINHLVDKRIDAIMARTHKRPIAQGRVKECDAVIFACLLGLLGIALLVYFINIKTAILTFASLIGYAGIYTGYLKRATSQNIVIGGLAGATPPLLGWVAVTNEVHLYALLLVLIIFIWTPPHFWALAIYRYEDYKNAGIPMLPVTHGIAYTKLNVLIYTIVLVFVSLLPYFCGMSGMLYAVIATLLGLRFVYWSVRLFKTQQPTIAMKTFKYSVTYLMLLFVALLADHYLQ